MKYRKEIDGLRALAVIPVILFHAGFATFSGGFVGVDIFFVISGYLITTIIVAEMEQGSFSLLNFYERRARRILPALFFMMLCTLLFAWLWMLPRDFKSFSQSLVAVPLFASNFLFWLTSGYFDTESELKPLLQTWSLAVEEQYYILFPPLLMLTWKLGKKWIALLLLLTATASLILAQMHSKNDPSFAFYLLPTRGFEILIGALISLYINDKPLTASTSHSLSLTGLALVLYAIFTFDKKTPFPSLYTLIPTIGAGLILVFANNKNLVGKFLGSKLLVGIGLISYGSYLWHQPLLAFARLRSVDDLTSPTIVTLCLSSLVFGYLSWKFLETPFRSKAQVSNKSLTLLSVFFTITFISIGLIGYINNGFDNRLAARDKAIAEWQNYDFKQALRRHKCFMEPENTYLDFKSECFGKYSLDAHLIWGDSYAAASSSGLRAVHSDIIQLTASACPPLIDIIFTDRPNCLKINNFIKKKVKKLKPKKIYLQSNWYFYKTENLIEGLRKTIEFIERESPKTKIIIIGSAPQWKPTLPETLIRKGLSINQIDYIPMPLYNELMQVDKKLIALANEKKINYISILDNLCVENKCLAVTKYNSKFWLTTWDDGHLTEGGSVYLYTKIKNLTKN